MGSEKLSYGVDECPPWYLCFFLAIQQFLTCFGAVFSYPLIISSAICINGDGVGVGNIINTVMFVCGLSSILQSTLGVRLPIIQGASYSFITPVFVLMAQSMDKCNAKINGEYVIKRGSSEHTEFWHNNVMQVGGALMVASAVQMVLGFSGLIGILVRYIGPLTIAPTICLIGLSLFQPAYDKASSQWWICFTTIILIAVFSQYLRNVAIPFFGSKLKIFSLFPILMGMVISWVICLVLTEAGALTDKPDGWGYLARTDIRIDSLHNAAWFRFPYPGQWGVPTVTLSGVLGMMAACIASMIESVGDYYACARLCGVASPPGSAISRGIGMEGITCLLAGAWGACGGNTSYSENVGAIGITKVGSRRVVQIAGIIMMILGCIGKFGALFVMLPDPVVGGLFYVMFGMVTGVGISNLQHVDLNSTRNLFVFGFSTFFGLSVPIWVSKNPFDVGNDTANQVLGVLCGTNMLVGGVVAFFLDNTIPGTREERGLVTMGSAEEDSKVDTSIYNLPLIQGWLNKFRITRYIPFCPGYVRDYSEKSNQHKYEQDAEAPNCEPQHAENGENGEAKGVDNSSYIPEKLPAQFPDTTNNQLTDNVMSHHS